MRCAARYVQVVEEVTALPDGAHRTECVLTSGVKLSAVVAGNVEADRVWVLVHGLASNARLWDGVVRRLATAGDLVIALDQRGHGHSSAPLTGYEMATVADDLAEVVTLFSDRPVVLVGQSWGGNVVLECAARHSERVAGVVGVDGGFIRLREQFENWDACWEALAPPQLDGVPRARIEQWLSTSASDWPEEGRLGTLANFIHLENGTIKPRLTRDLHKQVLLGLWEHDSVNTLRAVRCPVQFFIAENGDDERRLMRRSMVNAFRAQAQTPCDVVWFPDAHHDVHAQRPDDVTAALQHFASAHNL